MLKKLELAEMAAAAVVMRTSFDRALPTLAGLHTPEEDRWFFEERLFRDGEVWGAFDERGLVGIIAFRRGGTDQSGAGSIDQLYVLPDAQGRGLGSRLLEVAKSAFPRLCLWTFQRNIRARRFYERHGFVLVRETDGAGNEEKEPDALYCWPRA